MKFNLNVNTGDIVYVDQEWQGVVVDFKVSDRNEVLVVVEDQDGDVLDIGSHRLSFDDGSVASLIPEKE